MSLREPSALASGGDGGLVTNTLALRVIDRPPTAPASAGLDDRRTVVLVHGSLDRADSFRRVMRRLPEFRVIAYDRRGYQGSRALGAGTFSEHVADLLGLLAALGGPGACHLVVGHSLGGAVALGAALARPPHLAGVAAFEPPRCWGSPVASRQTPALGEAGGRASTPDQTVVRFFSAISGPAAWNGLPRRAQLERLADGPALHADSAFRGERPGPRPPSAWSARRVRTRTSRLTPPPGERRLAGRPGQRLDALRDRRGWARCPPVTSRRVRKVRPRRMGPLASRR